MRDSTRLPTVTPDLPPGLQLLAAGAMRFSLDGVPERERMPVFREAFGREVMKYDFEPLPDIPFNVDLKLQVLPGLMMMSGKLHGSRNQRTHETLATDPTDDIGMIVNLRGPHRIVNGKQEVVLGDGDAALVALGDPSSFTHRPPGDLIALRVPRKQFAPLVNGVDDCYVRRIPGESTALRLLTSYIEIVQGSVAEPQLQHVIASHVHDLMAVAVGASRDAADAVQARGVRAARLHAIKQDVVGMLDQPDLSVATIARRQGCTPRFVQRLFEAEGTTFTEYVLAQRLARAHRMLLDPRRESEKISVVAYDSGFGDVSYFNRMFRRHFGAAPSDIRAQARQQPPRTLM